MPHIFSLSVDKELLLSKIISNTFEKILNKGSTDITNLCSDNVVKLIPELLSNGVIMNPFSIALYFEGSFVNTIKALDSLQESGTITPLYTRDSYGFNYFLRSDIWKVWDILFKQITELNGKNVRRKYPLFMVDKYDLMFYYGLTNNDANVRFWNRLKNYAIRTASPRQIFYNEKTVRQLHSIDFFREAVLSSPYQSSCYSLVKSILYKKAENKILYIDDEEHSDVFRDMKCPRYDKCVMFSAETTEYINCELCPKYAERKGHIIPIIDNDIVFISPLKQKSHKKKINNRQPPNQ